MPPNRDWLSYLGAISIWPLQQDILVEQSQAMVAKHSFPTKLTVNVENFRPRIILTPMV
ncbi:MAG TPA: hypothetical protein VK673_19725 [Chthoniobacterales bacterium]|nr:hypothetical protein [Chthoniobacterales bacterium]